MFSDNAKRIVVIKDINSNMIEEAILILKNEPGAAWQKDEKEGVRKGKKKTPDFLLKEAELIINNYIKENKTNNETKKSSTVRQVVTKKKMNTNRIINFTLIASIAILLFIASRLL